MNSDEKWDVHQFLKSVESWIDQQVAKEPEVEEARLAFLESRRKYREIVKKHVLARQQEVFDIMSDDEKFAEELSEAKAAGWSSETVTNTRTFLLDTFLGHLAFPVKITAGSRLFGVEHKYFMRPK